MDSHLTIWKKIFIIYLTNLVIMALLFWVIGFVLPVKVVSKMGLAGLLAIVAAIIIFNMILGFRNITINSLWKSLYVILISTFIWILALVTVWFSAAFLGLLPHY